MDYFVSSGGGGGGGDNKRSLEFSLPRSQKTSVDHLVCFLEKANSGENRIAKGELAVSLAIEERVFSVESHN